MTDPKRTIGLLFLLGVGLLTTGVVFMENVGKTAYFVGSTPVEEVDGHENVSMNDTVTYDALPPTAQAAFDASLSNTEHWMYRPDDTDAIETLAENRYVEYDDQLYLVELSHGEGFVLFVWLRWAVAIVGGLLVALGAILLRDQM